MVHALKEIWRVLIPGGKLIDLRPRAMDWPLEIVVNNQVTLAGKVDNTPFVPDDSAAEIAMQSMVDDGRFGLEHKMSFDCASYWSTLEDMLAYYEESENPPFIVPNNVLANARGLMAANASASKVCVRYTMSLAKYAKPAR